MILTRLFKTQRIATNKQSLHHLSPHPKVVRVSVDERSAGKLTWKNLELATRALHHDGLVVLEDAISTSKLDALNEKMVIDARTLQAAGDASPYNYHKGNIQQDPPLTKRHFEREIFLNPLATQVTSSVLGPQPRLSFVSGNTALPPGPDIEPKSQPTHSDADFAHPNSPFALVINIPLIGMTVENGSTEVWLGTHSLSSKEVQEGDHGERASGMIKRRFLERRREERPPSQPAVKKGSIIVRDLRLWHGGMPNWTEQIRIMLAMIHFAPWYRNTMKVNFSEELKQELEEFRLKLQIQANFMSEQEILNTYLKGVYGNAYDFDQQDRLDLIF
ncbi:hypothetical protein BDZ94DRAFT_1252114 [Collybia nuda]|uniref:Phytanoyl-CoA dioxygenase n=1 Tax=Collybia nuda TaxID=64659 RepID=A0A9P6CHD7_9AGAR|nr:hypothetical protein BDZ94DRAFT_1252114 [Collybia nuda]